ncbi:MAG: hypothetical protein JWN37_214 [Candidatus Nomurabacteria bacterium]|nr:hypothetical protein [Candidatus Nomurabacteria bacterium]
MKMTLTILEGLFVLGLIMLWVAYEWVHHLIEKKFKSPIRSAVRRAAVSIQPTTCISEAKAVIRDVAQFEHLLWVFGAGNEKWDVAHKLLFNRTRALKYLAQVHEQELTARLILAQSARLEISAEEVEIDPLEKVIRFLEEANTLPMSLTEHVYEWRKTKAELDKLKGTDPMFHPWRYLTASTI